MTTIDRFIIGSAIGAQFVSYYSVPYQLGERSLVIPMALSDAIFPKIAQSSELGVRQIALRSLRLVSAIMLPIFCAGILFLHVFLRFYISADFAAVASGPGRLLLAGFCINCFGLCCYVCLQAGGKPKLVAIAHAIEILPFMACLILALREWGLLGAAAVFVARIAADALLLAFFSGVAGEFARITVIPAGILTMAILGGELATSFPAGGAVLGSGAMIASLGLGWQQLHAENLSPRALLAQLFPRWLSPGVSRR
jgi:O-antigen/teichoic acid export membrane protein